MSLAIKAPQPPNLIDQDRSHGTGSGDSKLIGMSLTQQLGGLSLAMPPPREQAEEYSSKEQEEEEEVDEDEDDELVEEDYDEDEFGLCYVCLKETEHSTFDCPYLDCIMDPHKTTVGSGYDIVCRSCYTLGGHPECGWVGRAIMKSCGICAEPASHWDSECPKNTDPIEYDNSSNLRVLSQITYTPSQ